MIICQMTREDLSTALDWAALEGWNPGLEDADAFFRADSEGFFAAEIDGALAASMSVVNHSDTFSFAGLYICRPEFRGRGIGLALWTQALDHAGDRTIGLDGVPAQQDNYRKSGFEWAGETLRFAGDVASAANPAVRRAEADDIPALLALDRRAAGYPREPFLRAWLANTATRRTLVFEANGRASGFATHRQCRQGVKIGPLLAEDIDTALALLHAAAEDAGNRPLIIDVPHDQTALSGYCERIGLTVSFNTARMYKGAAPTTGGYVQSVATLELG